MRATSFNSSPGTGTAQVFNVRFIRAFLIVSALALVVASGSHWRTRATDRLVVAAGGTDSGGNDCTDPDQPCATIGYAISQSDPGDLIELGPGTYFENVTVSKNVTIQGDGTTGSTVNGNNTASVFTINSGITATLSMLTITNGNANDSHVSVSGGGVVNSGTVIISNCTISGNSAGANGGGLENIEGTVTVINSTISGNSTGAGGGIDTFGGDTTVVNSTIADNTASDGAGNGGGIRFSSGTLNLTNTIIAGNTGGDCDNDGGTIGTNDHNLIQDGSCSPFVSGDPKLRPLQNNGGPTFTQALLTGSPAITAGDDAVLGNPYDLTTDQRGIGFPRKTGTHVDIGAVAFTVCPTITATVSGGGSTCSGASENIVVTISGGTAPYTVTLNNSGGTKTGDSPLTFTVNPSMTTTYSVASASDSDPEECPVTGVGSATVMVGSPPVITLNPVNQTISGGSVTFTAAASGTPTPTVQWQVSTNGGVSFTNISGATSTSLSFTPTISQTGYQYRAVFTNRCSTATTTAATLTIFDQCLKDNSSGDLFQFNSATGQYKFTVCSSGFTLSGTGVIGHQSGILTLTDSRSDRKISAGVNTGSRTGTATIYVETAQGTWQTYRINDTNPSATCTCGT
jgi:hypothetical protein